MSAKKLSVGIESVRMSGHILNNFDIPCGIIQPCAGDNTPIEHPMVERRRPDELQS
jgi:hypothetical protein